MGFFFGILLMVFFLIGLGVYTGHIKSEQIPNLREELTDNKVKTGREYKERIPPKAVPEAKSKKQSNEAGREHGDVKKEEPRIDFNSYLNRAIQSYRDKSSPGNSEQEIQMLHELEKARKKENINRLMEIYPH